MNDKTKTEVEKKLQSAGIPNPPEVIEALAPLFDGVWNKRDPAALMYLFVIALPGLVALAHSYKLV